MFVLLTHYWRVVLLEHGCLLLEGSSSFSRLCCFLFLPLLFLLDLLLKLGTCCNLGNMRRGMESEDKREGHEAVSERGNER